MSLRHLLLSLIFSIITITGGSEILNPNVSYMEQTEWYAGTVKTVKKNTFSYKKVPFYTLKAVFNSFHNPLFKLANLKKQKLFVFEKYKKCVLPSFSHRFLRLKLPPQYSSDEDPSLA